MNINTQSTVPTFESVWAVLMEVARRQEETARRQEELTESQKETDRIVKETTQQIKELRESLKESSDRLDDKIGKWSTNHGAFAEEYFINSFERGQRNFFGEKFDMLKNNVHGLKVDVEYDILLLNGKSVGIVEVKFKAHVNDIPKILKKAETFRINYPDYANHQIYLGLASFAFYSELETECIKEGIAVIKQVGDTMVINDKHLKAF